jgi:phage-related protein
VSLQLDLAQIGGLNKLEEGNAYLWFLEIQVPTDPDPTVFRFVRSPYRVDFGTFSTGVPITWDPFSFDVEPLRSDSDGTLNGVRVSVSNVTRTIQSALETYEGLVDSPVRVMLVNRRDLASGLPLFEFRGEVLFSSADSRAVAIDVGLFNLQSKNFPGRRAQRSSCRFLYGGGSCGYDTTRFGSLGTCDKTLDGSNGCEAHGDDEVAAGLARLHPARFGGFPGIARVGGLGT